MVGHIVLLPAATPHRPLRLVKDVDLLLAATIASVQMNQLMIVFEPPAWLAACARARRRTRRPGRSSRRRAGSRSGWSGSAADLGSELTEER
jgi:hypothetical protein